ncbi:hypothetical protein C8Q79DRAFT_311042 [Trametes meyenii]|nr:hypothetical protein C8Q79DRAFT_311042 [Trametes meyenii]
MTQPANDPYAKAMLALAAASLALPLAPYVCFWAASCRPRARVAAVEKSAAKIGDDLRRAMEQGIYVRDLECRLSSIKDEIKLIRHHVLHTRSLTGSLTLWFGTTEMSACLGELAWLERDIARRETRRNWQIRGGLRSALAFTARESDLESDLIGSQVPPSPLGCPASPASRVSPHSPVLLSPLPPLSRCSSFGFTIGALGAAAGQCSTSTSAEETVPI